MYIAPQLGTEIVARVPGDTEFIKLGDEGKWVKIKLLGGVEGFIQKSNIEK